MKRYRRILIVPCHIGKGHGKPHRVFEARTAKAAACFETHEQNKDPYDLVVFAGGSDYRDEIGRVCCQESTDVFYGAMSFRITRNGVVPASALRLRTRLLSPARTNEEALIAATAAITALYPRGELRIHVVAEGGLHRRACSIIHRELRLRGRSHACSVRSKVPSDAASIPWWGKLREWAKWRLGRSALLRPFRQFPRWEPAQPA